MIKPFLKDETLIADIQRAAADHSSFHLWWLGQSGLFLQWQGRHLLLDPYLFDSLTHKYANTDLPHIRMTELVIDPGRLDFIDVVTSRHNHTDHLDAETLIPLMKANPKLKLVIPEANRSFVTAATPFGMMRSWRSCKTFPSMWRFCPSMAAKLIAGWLGISTPKEPRHSRRKSARDY